MFWMSSDVMRKAPRQGCDHIGFSHRCFLIWADGNKTFQGLLGGAEWVRTWHFFWGGESGKKYHLIIFWGENCHLFAAHGRKYYYLLKLPRKFHIRPLKRWNPISPSHVTQPNLRLQHMIS